MRHPLHSPHTRASYEVFGIPGKLKDLIIETVATLATIWLAKRAYDSYDSSLTGTSFINQLIYSNVITNVTVSNADTCPLDFTDIKYGSYWPGSVDGCVCQKSSISRFYQAYSRGLCSPSEIDQNCENVYALPEILLSKWRGGNKICVKRDPTLDSIGLMEILKENLKTMRESLPVTCNEDEQLCGGQYCLPKTSGCPVVSILVGNDSSVEVDIEDVYESINLGSDSNENNYSLYLYYQSDNFNRFLQFFPIIDLYIVPWKVCRDADGFTYSIPSEFTLVHNKYCFEDRRFEVIDGMDDAEFYQANHFLTEVQSLKYELSSRHNSWNLEQIRSPIYEFLQCYMHRHGSKEVDKLIGLLDQISRTLKYMPALNRVCRNLQLISFIVCLGSGMITITLRLIQVWRTFGHDEEMENHNSVIFWGVRNKTIDKIVIISQFYFTYGLTAVLSSVILVVFYEFQSVIKLVIRSYCFDFDTQFSFQQLYDQLNGTTETLTVNVSIFLLIALLIIMAKMFLFLVKVRARGRLSGANINLETPGKDSIMSSPERPHLQLTIDSRMVEMRRFTFLD